MNATSLVLIEWKRIGYGEICFLVDKWDKKITYKKMEVKKRVTVETDGGIPRRA